MSIILIVLININFTNKEFKLPSKGFNDLLHLRKLFKQTYRPNGLLTKSLTKTFILHGD